jgi:hypothetical protein
MKEYKFSKISKSYYCVDTHDKSQVMTKAYRYKVCVKGCIWWHSTASTSIYRAKKFQGPVSQLDNYKPVWTLLESMISQGWVFERMTAKGGGEGVVP